MSKRRIVIILALIVALLSLPCVAQGVFVNKGGCANLGTPCTVPSTGTGNNIYVVVSGVAAGQPTTLSLGSNSFTKQATCSAAGGSNTTGTVCLWLVTNSVSGATSITSTGNVPFGIYEWEFSGMNTSTPFDIAGVCTGTSTCAASTGTLAQANEVVIAGFSCNGAITTVTGTNATFANSNIVGGDGGATAIVSATTSVTATADSGCGTGGAATAIGGAWAFKAAGGAAAPTGFNKKQKLEKVDPGL